MLHVAAAPQLSQPPSLISISPNYGPATSGTQNVVIKGGPFVEDLTRVWFGTDEVDPGDITFDSETQLTVVVPSHALGAVAVKIQTPKGVRTTSNAFTFAADPVVTSATPNTGDGGESVAIAGTGFKPNPTVQWDGVTIPCIYNSATEIVVRAPDHAAGAIGIKVINESLQEHTLAAAFTHS